MPSRSTRQNGLTILFFLPRATAGRTDGWTLIATLVEDWRRSPDPNENRLAFALYRPLSGRDVYVSTRFMIDSSKIDRVAGVFVRFRSPDDYYAALATAAATPHIPSSATLYTALTPARWTVIDDRPLQFAS
jgi:hypothetical protein